MMPATSIFLAQPVEPCAFLHQLQPQRAQFLSAALTLLNIKDHASFSEENMYQVKVLLSEDNE